MRAQKQANVNVPRLKEKQRASEILRRGLMVWLWTIVVVSPFLFGCVEPWSLSILETSVFCLTAVCLAYFRFDISRIPPLSIGAFGLAVLAVLQSLKVRSPLEPAFSPATVSVWASWTAGRLWLAYASLAWACGQLIVDRRTQRQFIWALFLMGVLFAGIGITQKESQTRFIYGLREISSDRAPFGPYYNRDHAAGLMALCFSLGGGLFASHFYSLRDRKSVGELANFLATLGLIFGGLAFLFDGMVLVASRGAWHALFWGNWLMSVLAVNVLMRGRGRVIGNVLVVFFLGGYLLLINRIPWFLGHIEGRLDLSTRIRMYVYSSCLHMLHDRFFWGFGLGAFKETFLPYYEPWIGGLVDHAHCDWLELFCGAGAVGTLFFLSCLAWQMWLNFREYLESLSSEMRWITGGGLAASFVFIAHSCLDFNFQIPASAAVFFALTAGLYAAPRKMLRSGRGLIKNGVGWAAFALVCFGGVSSAWSAFAWAKADRADHATLREKPYLIAKALSWDPGNPDDARALSATYLWLADATPMARTMFSGKALSVAGEAVKQEPMNAGLRQVVAAALLRLKRGSDAEWFLGHHKD